MTPPEEFYLVATRDRAGKLNPDWDGELHSTREAGELELATCNTFDGEPVEGNGVLLRCEVVA